MNDAADNFIHGIARLRQDPLAAARAATGAGQRVVGYVGDDIPVELIVAAGALPVRLRARPGDDATEVDRYVETSFTAETRAVAALWLGGALDPLDAVVFGRGDDSGQRLYYYVCELQRTGVCAGPQPLLFDVATLPRDASHEHTLDSARLLATQLGVRHDALAAARARVRQRGAVLGELEALRRAANPLPGSVAWRIERAAASDWRPSFDTDLRAWLTRAPRVGAARRLLLAGDPLSDDPLHLAVEAHGASIVAEITASVGPAASADDTIEAVADDCRRRESPAAAMRRDPRWLVERALEHRVDRVIVHASEQNEALPWELPRQMHALRSAGIPALLLARQPTRLASPTLARCIEFIREPGGAP